MDQTRPPEPHQPGSHCFVITPDGRQRLGLMVSWGQQPVEGGKPGLTEHHADVIYLDLDNARTGWAVKREWVHASRIISHGSAGTGGHTSRQA